MNERYQLMNYLYELILSDQLGNKLPEPQSNLQKHAIDVFGAIDQRAIKLVYSNGGQKHEHMLQLAKLYTSGLITLERGKGEDFVVKAVRNPDISVLTEFNEKLQR